MNIKLASLYGCVVFFLLFLLCNWSILKFSFLCHFHSAIELIWWIFNFRYGILRIKNFYFSFFKKVISLCWELLPFHLFQECSSLPHSYSRCFIFCLKIPFGVNIEVGICWISLLPSIGQTFLILSALGNFGLYPEHFEHYFMRFQVLLKSLRAYWFFCLFVCLSSR